MPAPVDSQAVMVSLKAFQRLLAAYPKAHRDEYGPAMAQLFRDQCRDAWRESRRWGLAALWLRVLPDLVKTSVLEHLATLNKRKSMIERIAAVLRPRSAPSSVFLRVFVVVFLLVVITCTLVTFLLPESYSSTARIKVDLNLGDRAGQAEFESIESEVVLDKVIDDLDLNKAWGKKYANGGRLKPSETIALLKGRIDLRPVRGTSLIEIRVFSDDRDEAAKIANAVADAYRDYRLEQRRQAAVGATVPQTALVEIVDRAVPGLRPVRPNKPLNIFLGVVGGMFLALAAGAGMAGIAAWLGRRSRGTGAPPGTAAVSTPDLPPAAGRRAKSTVDRIVGMLWMGIGGILSALALAGLFWFLIFEQSRVTPEVLMIPFFGLFWGCNAVLGFFLLRGKRWARICLGVEGVLLLIHFYFRLGFPLPHFPHWVFTAILQLGLFMVGPLPYILILRWMFIALGLASVCVLFWPRKRTATSPC